MFLTSVLRQKSTMELFPEVNKACKHAEWLHIDRRVRGLLMSTCLGAPVIESKHRGNYVIWGAPRKPSVLGRVWFQLLQMPMKSTVMMVPIALKELFWQASDVGWTILEPARENSRMSSLESITLLFDQWASWFNKQKKKPNSDSLFTM